MMLRTVVHLMQVAAMFAFMQNRWQFYLLRLLLGVTEAGSFPGMWYHLSLFYSSQDLGLAYSYVAVGSAVSQVRTYPDTCAPTAMSIAAVCAWSSLLQYRMEVSHL